MTAHVKAVEVDRLLKSTNWQGAPACAVLVGEIDVLIARLYNKAEKAMTRPQAAQSGAPAAPAEPEIPAAGELTGGDGGGKES